MILTPPPKWRSDGSGESGTGKGSHAVSAASDTGDLTGYSVWCVDGLFYVVGQEERKIRTDPAARVTDLLKEVFGK